MTINFHKDSLHRQKEAFRCKCFKALIYRAALEQDEPGLTFTYTL
jgi:hypothetical protein